MKSTPKPKTGTSKLCPASSEIWPGNSFSGNRCQPPTICQSIMVPLQFSFLHPERILFALQFFYKQYRTLSLNVSLPYSDSLMYIYLFFSPLPHSILGPYWLTKVSSRAVEMEGGRRKWDRNHYKSQSAETSHQRLSPPKETLEPQWEVFVTCFVQNGLENYNAEQHCPSIAQVLYSWFIYGTIPYCINRAAGNSRNLFFFMLTYQ